MLVGTYLLLKILKNHIFQYYFYQISAFIKNGRDFAVIEITIKNDTDNAYNHDIYGDEIKIIRRITTSGSSQYTVKSASGIKIFIEKNIYI